MYTIYVYVLNSSFTCVHPSGVFVDPNATGHSIMADQTAAEAGTTLVPNGGIVAARP